MTGRGTDDPGDELARGLDDPFVRELGSEIAGDLEGAAELPFATSADFVDRTVAAVRADRAQIDAEAARVESVRLPAALLLEYRVPAPSADFVGRTVRALPLRPLPAAPAAVRTRPRWVRRWVVPLAAAAALLVYLALPSRGPAPGDRAPQRLEAALYTPTPWITAFARQEPRAADAPEFEPPDALLLLGNAVAPR